jgi:hypothetical protein
MSDNRVIRNYAPPGLDADSDSCLLSGCWEIHSRLVIKSHQDANRSQNRIAMHMTATATAVDTCQFPMGISPAFPIRATAATAQPVTVTHFEGCIARALTIRIIDSNMSPCPAGSLYGGTNQATISSAIEATISGRFVQLIFMN